MKQKLIQLNESDLNVLKKIELDLLKKIDSICTKYNLKYFASSGTLLGAVRHKGFIPWDDDVDLQMPCKDFFSLIDIVNSQKDLPFYIENPINNSDSFISYAKVHLKNTIFKELSYSNKIRHYGVFIDIYPIISLPESITKMRRIINIYRFLRSRASCAYSRHNFKGVVKKLFFSIMFFWISPSKAAKKLATFIRKTDLKYSSSNLCTVETNQFFQKTIYNEIINVPFENTYLPIPSEYDEMLKVWYGDDYMRLPPVEKRISRHLVIQYDFGKYGGIK